MKKIKFYITCLSCCVLTTACQKDFLDGTKPENKISDADVWKSPELAGKVIDGAYNALPTGHAWFMMMSATDEGMFQYNDLGTPYTHATVTPLNLGNFSVYAWAGGQSDWSWDAVYRNIRNINTAITNLDQVPYKNEADRSRAKGDAYFLRGYSYYMLMAQFGGVVLYDKPVDFGSDYTIPRNTFEETVNFIVADLDKAIGYYDAFEVGNIKTRADKGVAMAAKAKVLLYAASDLHNSAKNGAITSGYAHPELIGYTGGDAAARWKAAKDAAKAVIDLNKYSLHQGNTNISRNFEEIFLTRTSEDMFIKYVDQQGPVSYYWGRTPNYMSTPGYGGSATNAVLGNLVDAFEMKDGSKFDWNNSQQKANPYANRDPRLYASVLYEGADWFERSSTSNKVRVGKWPDGNVAPDALFTNYWMRKYIDVTKGVDIVGWDASKYACPPWVRMRYAEVLLNYAEACIELGEDAEARTYINMVRARAGMPAVTESGDALKQRYRNERRVEFAFEEQRFFDVRRWLIGSQSSEDGTGVDVEYPTQGSFSNPTYKKMVADGGRKWDNKEYFIPITTDELNKNTALIQNPGY